MSGEARGQREKINAMVDQMVKSGAKPEYARQKAIESAKKNDRKR